MLPPGGGRVRLRDAAPLMTRTYPRRPWPRLASVRHRDRGSTFSRQQPTPYTHQRWPAPCSFSRSSPWRRPSRRSPGMRRSARRRPSRWPRLRSPSRSMLFPSCRRSSSPSRRAAASPAPRGRVAGALRARAPAATPRRGETGAARTEFDGGNISGDDGRVPRRPPRHLLPHVLPRHALHPVRGVQRARPRPPLPRARARTRAVRFSSRASRRRRPTPTRTSKRPTSPATLLCCGSPVLWVS